MMVDRILSPRRLRIYPLAALAGVVIGMTIFLALSDGLRAPRGGRVGGDFPAFYGAGRLVRGGQVESLYDARAQQGAQADLLPSIEGGWVHFAYPPQVAAVAAAFTLLDFKAAYLLHTLLMAACCVASLALLRAPLSILRHEFWPAIAATLTFYPMFRAVVGGQNTAVSLLCAAGAVACLARGRAFAAGAVLGAWLFKPQFAVPVVLVVALAGHPRVLAGFGAAAGLWYLAGIPLAGAEWPLWWWREGVVPFVAADVAVDTGNGISLMEVANDFGIAAAGSIGALVVALVTLYAVVRHRQAHPAALVGLAANAAVLASPHALYYDGGLAVLGLAAAGEVLGMSAQRYIVGAWLIAALHEIPGAALFRPVLIAVLASFVLSARACAVPGRDSQPRSGP